MKVKSFLLSLARSDWFFIVLLLILFFFYTGGFIIEYLSDATLVGGWDGSGHFVMSSYYADHIFPKPFGWVFNWYAGLPWPIGYPPLFHYMMGIIYTLLPFLSQAFLFKSFIVFLYISFFPLMYFLGKRIGLSSFHSFISSFLILLFFLLPRGTPAVFGIAFTATFQSGLIPQFVGAVLLFVWLFLFFDAHRSWGKYYLSLLIFSGIILTNIHIGQIALVVLFSFFLFDVFSSKKIWRVVSMYALYAFVSFLLISFWALPLLENLDYFLNKTLPEMNIFSAWNIGMPILLGFIGGLFYVFKHKKRELTVLFLSSFFILLISYVPLHKWIPSLPVQPFRLFPFAVIVLFFFIPYFSGVLVRWLNFPQKYSLFVFLPILIPFILVTSPLPKHFNLSVLFPSEFEMIRDVSSRVDGRSLVEVYSPEYPNHYDIVSLLGVEGEHETIWNVFRESAINSPFLVPIRNNYSNISESFGIVCMLCGPEDAEMRLLRDSKRSIDWLKLYGVKHLSIRYPETKERLDVNESLTKDSQYEDWFGSWDTYVLNEDQDLFPFVSVLQKEPVLVFSGLETKNRTYKSEAEYDWMRLQERWLLDGDLETVFVRSNNVLESELPATVFSRILILAPEYDSVPEALLKLSLYEGDVFVLMNSQDPLYSALLKSGFSHVVVDKVTGDAQKDLASVFEWIEDNPRPMNNQSSIKSFGKYYDSDQISIELNKGHQGVDFLYIKYSFFPFWKEAGGSEIFMASPALMVVPVEGERVSLVFRYSILTYVGMVISIVIFLYILASLLLNKERWIIHNRF